ncbi:hypothetical protein [Chryseolinea sp. H1M3-3]|jgi:hypothetical protein|uniref:hypothetical protein n=1 Tax=Chryseolinea sp. H1M3-3 TaxID=3034144 RepID=UPI0023EDD72C|nr:hypothetical protein [Chryseolinea sp. H1M3-3]
MTVKILISVLFSALLVFGPFGCDEDEKTASIEGSWQGKKAEGKVLVFGVPSGFEEEDNNLKPLLEFEEGGVVTLTQGGVRSHGTWVQDGEKLTMSLTFNTNFVDLSGTYDIQTLTDSKLVLYLEKEGIYEDPDTGIAIEGMLKATVSFDKQD